MAILCNFILIYKCDTSHFVKKWKLKNALDTVLTNFDLLYTYFWTVFQYSLCNSNPLSNIVTIFNYQEILFGGARAMFVAQGEEDEAAEVAEGLASEVWWGFPLV